MKIEEWARQNDALRNLLEKCGNRCHVIDNTHWGNNEGETYRNNQIQVQNLLNTIDRAVAEKGGAYFSSYLLQNPSLWERFRDAPTLVQVAAFLGVPEVSYLLQQPVDWDKIKNWLVKGISVNCVVEGKAPPGGLRKNESESSKQNSFLRSLNSFSKTFSSHETMANSRRIVLLGKTGTGKSSLGNTIFGDDSVFTVNSSPNSQTRTCQPETQRVYGRDLTIIDTPGFFDTDPNSSSGLGPEIVRSLEACAPGPHAFLLLLKVERYTEQEAAAVNLILQYFSEEALRYTTIVFTHGEELPVGMRIHDWARQNDALRNLLEKCGNRCHVVDNRFWSNQQGTIYRNNGNQVQDLLNTIDQAVAANGNTHFTSYLLQNPSLWERFRGAPVGVQIAALLGVAAVAFLLYQFIPWAKVLLCASGDEVKVFSTSTEECVHHLFGHTDLVTGLILRPSNHLQVFSCSLDGTVRLWDYSDGILIKTFVIGYPIHSIQASGSHDGVLFLTIPAKNDKRAGKFHLVAVQLPQSSEQLVEAREISAVLTDVSSNPGSISFGERFFLKEDNKKGAKNTFTCVACHPKEDCIATGHDDGKIRLWRNFNHKKEYAFATIHWHHNAVGALNFSPEGTNLLSGGIESVLVQWRYNQETQKDFLPRLGAAITHIAVSPDGSLFCTSHSDNKITIIHSYIKVSAVIQGDRIRTDLIVDPRSKALVMNGKPGHLQFYSLQRDKLLYNLDIVQQEYVHESGLDQFEVVKADFDAGGKWLATVEERKQNSAELELNLKLWEFDEQTQSFVLNTTVSAPHDARITDLSFSPEQTTLLVSTSKDGHFKAWTLAARQTLRMKVRPGPEVVTVWSCASWELLTTLSQPPGDVRNLCFGRLSCSKYLLGTTTKNQLCCWNLLTCSLEWNTSMDVTLLLSDPLSENMAAFCFEAGSTDLFVFKPSEPRPLFSHKAVCSGRVLRAVFTPREALLEGCEEDVQWLNRSQLHFFTPNMDLMTFTTKTEEDRLMASNKQLVIDDHVAMTPFHLLLGKRGQAEGQEVAEASGRVQPPQGSAAMKELLQTPAHVLPSTSHLCSMFVQSLLISTTDKREQSNVTEEEMESEKEEDESEDEEMPSTP
ncbi:hypothetical protein WMY93_002136 [Mugilogobius chulae]|uniref:AIG1-type G domain-containing protein n=1 Tax=Mugilogobius chulae TaxID=88201 RepID=A0AAW0Q1A2_9GOBI